MRIRPSQLRVGATALALAILTACALSGCVTSQKSKYVRQLTSLVPQDAPGAEYDRDRDRDREAALGALPAGDREE